MPFTFAHIGYILPIQKKWKEKLSVTGLIFGSIAPDYDILFRLTNVREHLFQYDLSCILFLIYPLALISAFSFHLFCRNVIIENLPIFLKQKYQKYNSVNFSALLKKDFLRISYSIVFAICLHLFLDYFCHFLDGFQVKEFIKQYSQNETIGDISYIFACYGLPILFSLVGFYLIYVYEYHRNLRLHYFSLTKQQWIFWISMIMMTVIICLIKFIITEADYSLLLDFVAILMTSAFIIAFYLTCIIYYFFIKKKAYA